MPEHKVSVPDVEGLEGRHGLLEQVEAKYRFRERVADAEVLRFLERVLVLDAPHPRDCWLWLGARSRGSGNLDWYGSFSWRGRVVRAHRFACDAIGGARCGPGMHRDHLCGVSLCVNPAHFEVVTHAENVARRWRR